MAKFYCLHKGVVHRPHISSAPQYPTRRPGLTLGRHQPLCIAPKARAPTYNSPPDRKQEGGSRVPCVPPTGRPQLRVRREEVEGLVSGCAIAVGPGTFTQRTWGAGAGAGQRGDFRGAAAPGYFWKFYPIARFSPFLFPSFLLGFFSL
ncbi:Hypothetical predicted protein [Marmota monax]|uniref:Uncharacterized protein n=1 Tax=Marmota monax TaxID=9995 RepID=A0A5E4CEB2_MARMO|nr:Hypothetical predicted protein [Marmota monax]